jgi:hypothetical protein
MKTKYLTSLLLMVVACSGGQTTGGSGDQTTLQLKKAAADASASHTAQGDACQEHGWYGDGECDRFCAGVDSVDCTPTDGDPSVVCALFVEEANGFCSRKAEDPCISQDPDCATLDPLPNDPIVCTAIAKQADGMCDANDPCAVYQDPDCAGVDPLPTEPPTDPIICPAIALEPDGLCVYDGKDVCAFYADPDCAAVDPLPPDYPSDPGVPACKVAAEPSDGVCSREATDPCLAADPDCVPGVACAAYIELSDGECKRDPSDPCIFQDPDCHVK